MSIYGQAKGTNFEKLVANVMQAEAMGSMMYQALARMAKEQGMDDVADAFVEAAHQEAVHSGYFATLLGKYPQDFWQLLRGLKKAEYNGEPMFMKVAAQFREAGMTEAADELEVFAAQERHHGEVIDEILAKYNQSTVDTNGKKVYICPVCGYEHIGELDELPEEYVCPICGVGKDKFVEKK